MTSAQDVGHGCCGGHHDHDHGRHGQGQPHGSAATDTAESHGCCGGQTPAPATVTAPKAETCCGGHAHAAHGGGHASTPAPSADLVRDPVCGMTVDPQTAKYRAAHEDRTYYFCSARCRERFEAEPAR